jgi:hypothetical protein
MVGNDDGHRKEPTKLYVLVRGGGVNRFSDRRIPLKKLFGFWIWRIFYTDLLICGSY